MSWLSVAASVAGVAGMMCGIAALVAIRACQGRLHEAKEEFQIMMSQQQTEYRDGIGEVSQTVEFLEHSTHSVEDALSGRLTNSVRSQAMQLLRAGIPPDKAAASLGMGRSEMRLISRVSRILAAL